MDGSIPGPSTDVHTQSHTTYTYLPPSEYPWMTDIPGLSTDGHTHTIYLLVGVSVDDTVTVTSMDLMVMLTLLNLIL